jgi:hypothetical protein
VTTSDDFHDPARLIRAAIRRLEQALHTIEDGSRYEPDAIAALERAHYRTEIAQRELATRYTDTYRDDPDAWARVADATGCTPNQARARFRQSGRLAQ